MAKDVKDEEIQNASRQAFQALEDFEESKDQNKDSTVALNHLTKLKARFETHQQFITHVLQ